MMLCLCNAASRALGAMLLDGTIYPSMVMEYLLWFSKTAMVVSQGNCSGVIVNTDLRIKIGFIFKHGIG